MDTYSAVLFDMDGVLIDSEQYWETVWRETIFPHLQDGTPTVEEVTGRSYDESLAELVDRYDSDVTLEALTQMFHEAAIDIYSRKVSLTPGIDSLFESLTSRGVAVAIVSSAHPDWIKTVVDRFDLPAVEAIVSAIEIDGLGKPEPDVYLAGASELGVDPADAIVVEDSRNGIEAALAASATVIGFARDHPVPDVEELHTIADTPEDLRKTIESLLEE
ncbi:HAD family hydrolase [Halalkalirubrum salinum]|uniref:HAD family hydrolase n=1 Tax=Halalkalirubrum salinum TaxID=2563889 RepID=UPI0010FAFF9B|nr:HAD family phosphatase [Halalkalirubrum salinum]